MLRLLLRSLLVLALLAFIAAAIYAYVRGPRLLWERTRDARPLDVLIVDKTVADRSYREHAGLVWLLNHRRYETASGATRRASRDYVGVKPTDAGTVREVPIDPAPRSRDLVYVADTYGVYEDDLQAKPSGARSSLVEGGITVDEVDRLAQSLRPGGTIVAEFNTFASPTRPDARERLGALVGVRWSGWIGRHFRSLERDDDELPAWLVPAWERQEGKRWDLSGGGYVLVEEDGRVVVLREGRDIARGGISITFPKDTPIDGVPHRTVYDYWFDIVEARGSAEIMASYDLDLTASGRALLVDADLPETFPAVLRLRDPRHTGWYFAGDFADVTPLPDRFDRRGLVKTELAKTSPKDRDDQGRFFWGTYAPLLDHVLDGAWKTARK